MSYRNFSNVLNVQIEIHAFKYIQEIAKAMTEEALAILEDQRYAWEPLTQKYWDWKDRRGLDTRVLIATGFYQEHINWGVRDDNSVWWGVEDVIHPPSGLPLRVLARIHEFGTAVIPARPLWRPLLSKYLRRDNRFKKRYKREVQRQITLAARKHLKQPDVEVEL